MKIKAMLLSVIIVCTSFTALSSRADAATYRGGCNPAIVQIINQKFPPSARGWAVGVAWRESRCIPTAANRRSSARGIFQMMVPLHRAQFAAVGCSWTQWANPYCNIAAAAHLYRQQGTRPWR